MSIGTADKVVFVKNCSTWPYGKILMTSGITVMFALLQDPNLKLKHMGVCSKEHNWSGREGTSFWIGYGVLTLIMEYA